MDAAMQKLGERALDFGLAGVLIAVIGFCMWIFGPKLIDRLNSELAYLRDNLKAEREALKTERAEYLKSLEVQAVREDVARREMQQKFSSDLRSVMDTHERAMAALVSNVKEQIDELRDELRTKLGNRRGPVNGG